MFLLLSPPPLLLFPLSCIFFLFCARNRYSLLLPPSSLRPIAVSHITPHLLSFSPFVPYVVRTLPVLKEKSSIFFSWHHMMCACGVTAFLDLSFGH